MTHSGVIYLVIKISYFLLTARTERVMSYNSRLFVIIFNISFLNSL